MILHCCARNIATLLLWINAFATIIGIVLIIAGIVSLLNLYAIGIDITLIILGVTTIVPGFFGFLGAYRRSTCQLSVYWAWLIFLALPKAAIAYLIMADNQPTIDVLARAFKLTEGDDDWTIKIRHILDILWKAIVDNFTSNVPEPQTEIDPKYVSMAKSLGYFCISMVSLEMCLVASTWILMCFICHAKKKESAGDSCSYDSFEMTQSCAVIRRTNAHEINGANSNV